MHDLARYHTVDQRADHEAADKFNECSSRHVHIQFHTKDIFHRISTINKWIFIERKTAKSSGIFQRKYFQRPFKACFPFQRENHAHTFVQWQFNLHPKLSYVEALQCKGIEMRYEFYSCFFSFIHLYLYFSCVIEIFDVTWIVFVLMARKSASNHKFMRLNGNMIKE